jgi:hypothetical protein
MELELSKPKKGARWPKEVWDTIILMAPTHSARQIGEAVGKNRLTILSACCNRKISIGGGKRASAVRHRAARRERQEARETMPFHVKRFDVKQVTQDFLSWRELRGH